MQPKNEAAIWSSGLDNKYQIEVQRIDSGTGTFVIFDTADNKVLFTKVVPLYYGAQFGPDVMDVEIWQEMGIKFADTGKVE